MKTSVAHRPHSSKDARGFTLVEVLVSLVILAIGLLGIAKLMMFSSRSNDSAYLRSQATELAYEMLDDMRANKTGAAALSYVTAKTSVPGVTPNCYSPTVCNSTQTALWDVYQWKQRLSATLNPGLGALPGGQGSVATTINGAETTVTIIVYWDDSTAQSSFGAAAAAAQQNVTLETNL